MNKNYTIGLDIGTNSVGWAVVRDNLTLVRRRMKVLGDTDRKYVKRNFLGTLLFESGETAQQTRIKRTARRRYERRRNRILELQNFFSQEISKIDDSFFHRLDESFLVVEDKEYSKHPIFGNLHDDLQYHEKYPTIYHLRKELSDSKEKHDIRLVYLALSHIIKYRGNFLIEGNLDTNNISIQDNFKEFVESYNINFSSMESFQEIKLTDDILNSISEISKEKISRTRKLENMIENFTGIKRNDLFGRLLNLIVGNLSNFKTSMGLEEDAKLQFSDEDYETNLSELLAQSDDQYEEVFTSAYMVFNAIELSTILSESDKNTNAKLSSNMVKMYEDHKKQLKEYKAFVRKHKSDEYFDTFRNPEKNGYSGYIDGTKVTQDIFYKYATKQFEASDEGKKFVELIENEQFLRKQRSFYNGNIPHQVHLAELRSIIQSQGEFYPFLIENQEKIELLVKFRIPYYVGPLAKGQSRFAWLERKSDEKIKPWNFSEAIDLDKSAINFIENLTAYDTYLPEEKVLPKRSLTYQKYAIFNELTKVTYVDDWGEIRNFSSQEKLEIFDELFKRRTRVTSKQLADFLRNNYHVENTKINGIDKAFNANYSTYLDLSKIEGMKKILDDDRYEYELEDIVKILTVFEDRKMRKRQLEKYSDILDNKTINELSRKHYTGWGRLSYKLINGLRDSYTQKTIIDFLIDDDSSPRNINRNFMQLINDENLSFKEKIEEHQNVDVSMKLKDIVDDIPGNPAIKKGILLSIRIVEEIIDIMGYKPENIVVEMAREHQTTDYGTRQSRQREKRIKDGLKEFGSNLDKEEPINDNSQLRNDRLYLYYLQNGKDMYTGNDLDISNLSNYDIDHIIPQSFITDNSIDNIVLTSAISNRGKMDDVPNLDIVKKQKYFWKQLLDSGLMTERKFNNLTKSERGGLTEFDKERFINRQLVETRQITKYVANILDNLMNPDKDIKKKDTNIILLKSALTSQFRSLFSIYKFREVNDYHHAHDAYLNASIAIKIIKLYPNLAKEFVYGDFKYTTRSSRNKATAKKMRMTNLINRFKREFIIDENGEYIWDRDKEIRTIKNVISYRQVNVVKKVEETTGMIFKETINPRPGKVSDKRIPIKNHLDPLKYGGYIEEKMAFYVGIEYKDAKNKVKNNIVGISIKDKPIYEKDSVKYLESLGFNNPTIIHTFKNYTLFEFEDGTRRLISGASNREDNIGELQKGNQFYLQPKLIEFLYHINRYDEINYPDSFNYVNNNMNLFDEVIAEVSKFGEKYINAENRLTEIKKLYDDYKNRDNSMDIDLLAESFMNLFNFTRMGAPSTFSFINKNVSRKRYTILTTLWDSVVIYQSLTGLYETRVKMRRE